MKALDKTYVIVKLYASSNEFIQNYVSFSINKLSIICDELNSIQNEKDKEHYEKKNQLIL